MAEYNNAKNNASDAQKHVTTRNTNYYNGKAQMPSALTITYYDDAVRIMFAPELPENEKTERRRYDYEHQVITSLSRAKCQELYNAYKKVIVPAIVNGEDAQVSVPLAGINQLMISTNVGSDGVPHPVLKYIKGIDEHTRIADPHNVITYEFNTGEYILGYDETTGNFKDRVVTYNELELFMRDLDSHVMASSNAFVHTDRVVNRYWKDTLDNKIVKVGEKLGVDLAYHSNTSNRYTGGSIFDTNRNTSTVESVATQSTVTSLDALEQELTGGFPV